MITGPKQTLKLARKLRSEMSLPEGLLWRELRKRPGGFKFRRQHPASVYVLDFYCAAAKLAIEVDGFAHESVDAAKRDAARSRFLRSQGVATTRIPARLILSDVESVILRLVEVCDARVADLEARYAAPLHHAAHGPPPRFREE